MIRHLAVQIGPRLSRNGDNTRRVQRGHREGYRIKDTGRRRTRKDTDRQRTIHNTDKDTGRRRTRKDTDRQRTIHNTDRSPPGVAPGSTDIAKEVLSRLPIR